MSIRNISTNKKSSRLRKNYLAQRRIGDTGRGANNSKNFETALPYKHQQQLRKNDFRPNTKHGGHQDQLNQVVSDEEQQNYMTESQDTFRNKHHRSETVNIWKDQRFGQPIYSRITHASKQQIMEGALPLPQSRMGMTMMGFHRNQESLTRADPIMQSMPNIDFRLIKEKSYDISSNYRGGGTQLGGPLKPLREGGAHNNEISRNHNTVSVLDQRQSSQGFHSPQVSLSFNQPTAKQLVAHDTTNIFEEFFIIGVDQQDLSKQDWNNSDKHFLAPKTLYMHINSQVKEDAETRRVVKDFCFPDGIEVSLIKKANQRPQDMKIGHKIQQVLYQSSNLMEQYFIFTLNSNDTQRSGQAEEEEVNQEILETFPGQQ